MKPLTLALFGALMFAPIPGLQQPAMAQDSVTRLAYEQCVPDLNVWAIVCSVVVVVDGHEILFAPGSGPAWSPDGGRVAFDAPDEILIGNLADGAVGNVTGHPARDISPAWSRDGRIAFLSDRSGAFELYVMNGDGANVRRLTINAGVIGSFAWAPDGGRIAFASESGGNANVFVIDAAGSTHTRLTDQAHVSGQVVWSADGARLGFECEIESGNKDLCVVNPDGTNFIRATIDPLPDMEPAFSPVDSRIAFTRGGQIAVLEVGGAITLIGAAGSQPAWSPDARRIGFVGTTTTRMGHCYPEGGGAVNADEFCVRVPDIYEINVDGTGFTLIANGSAFEWYTPVSGRPIAAFTAQCIGSRCEFDASGSQAPAGAALSYAWQFGDGTTASGVTPGHTYAPGGWFIVTLTVTNAAGEAGVLSKWVYANVAPIASFTVTCAGPTCTFDGSASADPDGSIAWHYWLFGDGNSSGSAGYQPTAIYTYPTGTFTATLVVSDGAGTASRSQTVTVVNALPVASFTVTCAKLTCTFDASQSTDVDGFIRVYWWRFGDGGWNWDWKGARHTYPAPGTYVASLTVSDDVYQEAVFTKTITVVGNAAPTASFAASCTDAACSFDASGSSDPDGTIASHTWNFADGTSGSGVSPVHVYRAAGTYAVTLVVTDNAGATSSVTRSVTILPSQMHIGDLDATFAIQQGSWAATVTIGIHDKLHAPIAGATVKVAWNDGTIAACTTTGTGRCSVVKSGIPRKSSVTLNVTGVTHGLFIYAPGTNHDADRDSNGTTISIAK
jgi:PKD repeat protein